MLQLFLSYPSPGRLALYSPNSLLAEVSFCSSLIQLPTSSGLINLIFGLSKVAARQGSFNDLQSLLLLNLTIVTVGGLIKHFVVDPAANARNLTLDQDWYRVRRPVAFCCSACCTPWYRARWPGALAAVHATPHALLGVLGRG